MSLLHVSEVSRQEDEVDVLKNISFAQEAFQNIALSGATGSGKTTLLKIIGGLVQPHKGQVLFEGKRVEGPDEKLLPGHPGIAYLSQYFELRNHYHVEELLQMANQLPQAEAALICEVCRIGHLVKRWTHQLSGGEKQRIALACLLVSSPRLLLLDEPYSNLDAIHKNILKSVIHDIGEHLKITSILVSHDPDDTLSWADEIIVLKNGEMIQKGPPETIYKEPVNEYVAALFGKYSLLSPALAKAFAYYNDIEMQRVDSFIRPENFVLTQEGKGVQAEVTKVNFLGSFYETELSISGNRIIASTHKGFKKGEVVYVSLL
jgi:ABC-type glutathione transport system ATPase component